MKEKPSILGLIQPGGEVVLHMSAVNRCLFDPGRVRLTLYQTMALVLGPAVGSLDSERVQVIAALDAMILLAP